LQQGVEDTIFGGIEPHVYAQPPHSFHHFIVDASAGPALAPLGRQHRAIYHRRVVLAGLKRSQTRFYGAEDISGRAGADIIRLS